MVLKGTLNPELQMRQASKSRSLMSAVKLVLKVLLWPVADLESLM